ncbi:MULTISPECIES: hypothetical protein [Butyricimonas]|uniref:hypothetical protein n=1 Tax=Butyricimonas TaxID=574697 RepID=UPI0007FB5858|nr:MULTISPECIES: hypothetical protein [Butyricimonas]
MKARIVLICLCIWIVSCKDDYTRDKEHSNIESWIPAYKKYPEVSASAFKIKYCFRVGSDVPLEQETQEGKEAFRKSLEEQVYPEYYGGYYTDQQNSPRIIVFLTDTSSRVKSEFIELCQIASDDITFEPCTYSYNELLRLQKKLSCSSLFEKWNIESTLIRHNKLYVLFNGQAKEETIARFKAEVMDSPMLVLKSTEEYDHVERNRPRLTSQNSREIAAFIPENVRCGNRFFVNYGLYNPDDPTSYNMNVGRMGFCAYARNSFDAEFVYGFVTAAHNFNNFNKDIWISPYILEAIDSPFAYPHFIYRSSIDCAFCRFSPGYYIPKAHNPAMVFSIEDGMKIEVLMRGSKYPARVQDPECNIDINGCNVHVARCYFSDITRRPSLEQGDSGTLVLTSTESSWINGDVVGIVVAMSGSDVFFVVPAINMTNCFDIKFSI